MAAHRKRHRSTNHCDQPVARRHLSRSARPAGWHCSSGAYSHKSQLSAVDARDRSAAQDLCQHLRHRYRARRARSIPRPRGQCADALRGKLCRGKPAYDAARLSRSARRDRLAPNRKLRREADLCAVRSGPCRDFRSAGRSAFSGHLQFGLFRTCFSGARDGRPAGRGTGPSGRGRPRLYAHHGRPVPGRRNLSAHRGRLSRSRGLPSREHAGRAGG